MLTHELAPAEFDQLATGSGGASAVAALRSAQISKNLLFVRRLMDEWVGPAEQRATVTDALSRAQAAGGEQFREVFGEPLLGAWAAIVNRAGAQGALTADDCGQLAAWAMVACAATGVDARVGVPVRDGVVPVPSVGAVNLGAPGPARLVSSGGRLEVHADDIVVETSDADPRWLPLRSLTATTDGQTIRVSLDDLDPFRHGHHVPPASRLSESEVERWRTLFDDAWRRLMLAVPERAAELRVGLRALVPLVDSNDGSARSATIRHAFGVFGLTRPPSAAEFAVTLVHEFQHSKLSAILDLIPLTDPDDPGRYFAPWRVDPRPLAGLLQGVYAFVGVADTWRGLRLAAAAPGGPGASSVEAQLAEAQFAEAQFAEGRLQVDRGLSAVEQSDALTPAGRVVAQRLRSATDGLMAEPVSASAVRAAEQKLARIREQWLARNGSAGQLVS